MAGMWHKVAVNIAQIKNLLKIRRFLLDMELFCDEDTGRFTELVGIMAVLHGKKFSEFVALTQTRIRARVRVTR